jgi:hypothetical protein
MGFDSLGTGIALETFSNCPHCGRPLLGLACDKCGFCGRSLEACFPSLPEVSSRLEKISRGFTPETFVAWAQPRPGQLLWALGSGHWKLLGYWVAEDLWRTWARLFANLKGRWRARAVEALELNAIALCGIGEFEPWVKLRVKGRRADYHWNTQTGEAFQGTTEVAPFQEIWTFVPTGQPLEKTEHQCAVCAGGLDFTDLQCPYCGCPVNPVPGPWRLVSIRAESIGQGTYRSPFEASVGGAGELD